MPIEAKWPSAMRSRQKGQTHYSLRKKNPKASGSKSAANRGPPSSRSFLKSIRIFVPTAIHR